jgi:hypothetical protein
MTIGKADASPTKAFFVRMLTRDITIDDCILDLVDNSIDGAWESSGKQPSELKVDQALDGYSIEISVSPEKFSISDNCGGITLDEAANYAFTFGRKSTEPESPYTVGVYGIGMKRAIFKLGNSIRISSTYQEKDGQLTAFLVPIEVEQWARDGNEQWDFDLEALDASPEAGVRIEITKLSSEISQKFQDPTYERTLRGVLARDYLLPLMRGLHITVNGTAVVGAKLVLQEGGSFAPMRNSYVEDNVTVEILAGMASAPPESTDPEEGGRADVTSGWYVLCNGRAVLAADKSSITGWGSRNTWPTWHNQYNGFLGIVLFSASDPGLLPMTTTKRSVDASSGVYIRALVAMEQPARAWIDYTNAKKNDRDAAKSQEQQARPVPLAEIRLRDRVQLPRLTNRPPEPMANVNYAVTLKRLRSLGAGLGNINMTRRDVGLKSFEYAYERLVDEEDS